MTNQKLGSSSVFSSVFISPQGVRVYTIYIKVVISIPSDFYSYKYPDVPKKPQHLKLIPEFLHRSLFQQQPDRYNGGATAPIGLQTQGLLSMSGNDSEYTLFPFSWAACVTREAHERCNELTRNIRQHGPVNM